MALLPPREQLPADAKDALNIKKELLQDGVGALTGLIATRAAMIAGPAASALLTHYGASQAVVASGSILAAGGSAGLVGSLPSIPLMRHNTSSSFDESLKNSINAYNKEYDGYPEEERQAANLSQKEFCGLRLSQEISARLANEGITSAQLENAIKSNITANLGDSDLVKQLNDIFNAATTSDYGNTPPLSSAALTAALGLLREKSFKDNHADAGSLSKMVGINTLIGAASGGLSAKLATATTPVLANSIVRNTGLASINIGGAASASYLERGQIEPETMVSAMITIGAAQAASMRTATTSQPQIDRPSGSASTELPSPRPSVEQPDLFPELLVEVPPQYNSDGALIPRSNAGTFIEPKGPNQAGSVIRQQTAPSVDRAQALDTEQPTLRNETDSRAARINPEKQALLNQITEARQRVMHLAEADSFKEALKNSSWLDGNGNHIPLFEPNDPRIPQLLSDFIAGKVGGEKPLPGQQYCLDDLARATTVKDHNDIVLELSSKGNQLFNDFSGLNSDRTRFISRPNEMIQPRYVSPDSSPILPVRSAKKPSQVDSTVTNASNPEKPVSLKAASALEQRVAGQQLSTALSKTMRSKISEGLSNHPTTKGDPDLIDALVKGYDEGKISLAQMNSLLNTTNKQKADLLCSKLLDNAMGTEAKPSAASKIAPKSEVPRIQGQQTPNIKALINSAREAFPGATDEQQSRIRGLIDYCSFRPNPKFPPDVIQRRQETIARRLGNVLENPEATLQKLTQLGRIVSLKKVRLSDSLKSQFQKNEFISGETGVFDNEAAAKAFQELKSDPAISPYCYENALRCLSQAEGIQSTKITAGNILAFANAAKRNRNPRKLGPYTATYEKQQQKMIAEDAKASAGDKNVQDPQTNEQSQSKAASPEAIEAFAKKVGENGLSVKHQKENTDATKTPEQTKVKKVATRRARKSAVELDHEPAGQPAVKKEPAKAAKETPKQSKKPAQPKIKLNPEIDSKSKHFAKHITDPHNAKAILDAAREGNKVSVDPTYVEGMKTADQRPILTAVWELLRDNHNVTIPITKDSSTE